MTRGGENVRELDIYAAAGTVARWIADELKPDVVVDAGDRWDQARPSPLALRHGYDFDRVLEEAGIPRVVCAGNHDTPTELGKTSPLEHLQRYFNANVCLDQQTIEVAGLAFHVVPYRPLSRGLLAPVADLPSDVPTLLVAHCTVEGEGLPDFAKYDHTRLPRSVLGDERFSARLLGHIHINQQVGPDAWYAGAPERLTWGEIRNEPAILVHTVHPDGRVETERVPISQMGVEGVPRPARVIVVDGSQLTAEQALESAVSQLRAGSGEGELVSMFLDQVDREIFALHYEKPLQEAADKLGVFALRVKVDVRDDEEAELLAAASGAQAGADPAPVGTLAETYRRFAVARGEEDLMELGASLIAQAAGEAEE